MPLASRVCGRKNAKGIYLIRNKHNYCVVFQLFSQICVAWQVVKAVEREMRKSGVGLGTTNQAG
jgi:hypothetical protein